MEVPESASVALGLPPERLANTLLMAAAVKLYESGRLSSGAAAELAGMPKPVFVQRLAEFGVDCFRQTTEELRRELANA
jgi:predicted HTH domain antitoxin